MERKIVCFFSFFFWLLNYDLNAQSGGQPLSQALLKADSVVLLSHLDIRLPAHLGKDGNLVSTQHIRIINENGELEDSLIIEKSTLGTSSIAELEQVLTIPDNDSSPAEKASCFYPHHTIVIFKNGHFSFLDICFSCRRFETSKDLVLPKNFLYTDQVWFTLKQFFLKNEIKDFLERR